MPGTNSSIAETGRNNGDRDLRRACSRFEALFIREILSASGLERILGSPSPLFGEGESGGSPGAMGAELYASDALSALAEFLAARGVLGLGEALYRGLVGIAGEEGKTPGDG
ncbi:MAG: hypothetical protein QME89_06140 [Actinomycetota bacterium]|nr:hypothetical protein [Actinomycetota bacterium]